MLREYAKRVWTRHADALSAAIADDAGVSHDNLACQALARFVLEIPALTRGRPDHRAAVEELFDLLTHGRRPPTPSEPQTRLPAPR
ncbi:hypothetical protein GCM10009733_087590 [Nonomuraea maheshkhaliensis]|uniref:Uncharacterized protein n=1 Tax=Nonomuraea maheshkhaliensis TaxID=419590 RepID=A0ABN2GUU0_9ACTN